MRRLARYVYYALSAALLGLFLIGYMARYVHPYYMWWTELVAIGLPYLALAAVLSAVGAAALRAWRLAAAHAVVLGLALLRFGGPLPSQGDAAPRPGDLRVMTFNVPRWGSPPEETKTRRLRALVDSVEPDLLALQEALVFYYQDGLGRHRSRSYVYALTKPPVGYDVAQAGGSKSTMQPILARVPLFDLSQQTLRVGDADTDEEDDTYVVRTGFEWKGRRAVLYNVHLRSFGKDKPWQAEDLHLFDLGFWKPYLRQYRDAYRARAREVERIRTMLDEEQLPVIVAGDFNSTPHSWAYRQLVSGGMQDAFGLVGDGWGSTYHTQLPFTRIDFVLASEEWEVVDARVPEAVLSDHRPLLATLRWRDEGEG